MTAIDAAPARAWPKPDNVLRLRDSRILGYAEYGDPDGRPAFLFHGHPGSRLEGVIAHEAGARRGVRVICPDRPGYGLSDFKLGRSILDWTDDVLNLASALGIERFAVGGISGGGPYAAACALRIPDHLTGAAIISGFGPFDAPGATEGMLRMNRMLFLLARHLPWAVRVPVWLQARLARRSPDRLLDLMTRALPEPDRMVLSRPEVWRIFRDDIIESMRRGSRGAAWESILYTRPWGFRLEDIAIDVHLWQGGVDANVPPSMGRYQARAIPRCSEHFYPDEGHLLVIGRIDEIIEAATGAG